MNKTISSAITLSLVSSTALAHPGAHSGSAFSGLQHVMSHPDHWLVAVGLLTAAVALATRLPRRKRQGSKRGH